MTLVELLVAMVLMLVILSATLLTFERFLAHAKQNEKTNDQQQLVREVIDRLARQLRNLANPTTGTSTIAYADNYKLVFQTTDPNRQWVAYCLERTDPTNEVLYRQIGASVAVPGTGGCPVSGTWTKQIKVVSNAVNDINGQSRHLFEYYSQNGLITPGGSGVANPSTITRAVVDIHVDLIPGKRPDELSVNSGVTMRNQNQSPTARFKANLNGINYSMDGSASTDPEGRNLRYDWYTTPSLPVASNSDVPTNPGVLGNCNQSVLPTPVTVGSKAYTCVGGGVVLSKPLTSGTTLWLRVTDPGQLADLSDIRLGGCPTNTTTAPSPRSNTECQGI